MSLLIDHWIHRECFVRVYQSSKRTTVHLCAKLPKNILYKPCKTSSAIVTDCCTTWLNRHWKLLAICVSSLRWWWNPYSTHSLDMSTTIWRNSPLISLSLLSCSVYRSTSLEPLVQSSWNWWKTVGNGCSSKMPSEHYDSPHEYNVWVQLLESSAVIMVGYCYKRHETIPTYSPLQLW